MLNHIVRMNMLLYELKQAARQLYKLLVPGLIEIGLKQCLLDPCLMRFMIGGVMTGAVVMHVDDIVFAGAGGVSKTAMVLTLNDTLPAKYLGELSGTWVLSTSAT